MKLEIIETRDYILSVSKNLDQLLYNTSIQELITKGHVKAHLPKGNAPELDLLLLPEMVVEDVVENLALTEALKEYPEKDTSINAFIKGYKAATKKYSEEDFKVAMKRIHSKCYGRSYDLNDENEIIQSLKQPTPKWFVAETIQKSINGSIPVNQDWEYELKTTTNSEGKKVLVGKYLYE
jgi:hypothetical protein